MKKTLVVLLFMSALFAIAQPSDPTKDPDSLKVQGPPGDPSGDPDEAVRGKQFVCDSVAITKQFVILYYKRQRVAVYRKEEKANPKKVGWYSFY